MKTSSYLYDFAFRIAGAVKLQVGNILQDQFRKKQQQHRAHVLRRARMKSISAAQRRLRTQQKLVQRARRGY